MGAVDRLFCSQSSIGSRQVTSQFSGVETLLASARARPYARSGEAVAWVEAHLVAVAVESVSALPDGGDWADAAGRLIALAEDASLRYYPFQSNRPLRGGRVCAVPDARVTSAPWL